MEFPPEIVSKIMLYHSNIRFSKDELLDYVRIYQGHLKCIECELYGDMDTLFTILYSDKRIGKRFFKWVDGYEWRTLYNDHYNISN
jgi:hypothetical protein